MFGFAILCHDAGDAALRQKGENMTSREKAEDYFHRICDGHRNAIQRPADPSVDRIFRNMVEKANCNGDCIINVGKGVFRPIPSDPVDEAAFHEYIAKDLHRARAIQLKRLCMKQTYDSWSRCSEVSK